MFGKKVIWIAPPLLQPPDDITVILQPTDLPLIIKNQNQNQNNNNNNNNNNSLTARHYCKNYNTNRLILVDFDQSIQFIY